MAVIDEAIGVQGFDRVANRIAEILLVEIANQQNLQNFDDDVKVFIERIQPFSRSEDVSISVYLKGGTYEGYTEKDTQGEYQFFIDLYTSSVGTQTDNASVVSKNKNYRYLGLIRYILSSTKFMTLGFPPGLIGGKYVKSISQDLEFANFGAEPSKDGSFIRFSRVLFVVRVQENQAMWDSIPLQGNDTNVTYNQTDLGTQLTFNN